jgi:hypothetical protein
VAQCAFKSVERGTDLVEHIGSPPRQSVGEVRGEQRNDSYGGGAAPGDVDDQLFHRLGQGARGSSLVAVEAQRERRLTVLASPRSGAELMYVHLRSPPHHQRSLGVK